MCGRILDLENGGLETQKSQARRLGFLKNYAGDHLISHTVSRAVPSAQRGLTSVFGMGTGDPSQYGHRQIVRGFISLIFGWRLAGGCPQLAATSVRLPNSFSREMGQEHGVQTGASQTCPDARSGAPGETKLIGNKALSKRSA
jgi:hypothetical protein